MNGFFENAMTQLIPHSPNGLSWWHTMPLPGDARIKGKNPDLDLQYKMWEALKIPSTGGLAGKRVLDIGANDGFFTLAAYAAGASHVTAVNSADWVEWPHNIRYASERWGVTPELITADFRTYPFTGTYDVIFFFGVLYHLEDVFTPMKLFRSLLVDGGSLYIETQMSKVVSDLPIFEYTSDIYPTASIQCKRALHKVGISNYLLPNDVAMHNLAHSYDFEMTPLEGDHNRYTKENPLRKFFRFDKRAASPTD